MSVKILVIRSAKDNDENDDLSVGWQASRQAAYSPLVVVGYFAYL